MRSLRISLVGYAVLALGLSACKDKAPAPAPSDTPAPGAAASTARPAPAADDRKPVDPPAAAAPPPGEFAGALHNIGMWSEMYAYCGWKAEPFKDLRARLLAAPKLAGAKADIETYFDRGARYGADEAKKRADQKAKGEKPSAWACGANVEASVLKELESILAAR
ncbi:MAG: hypothetical protein FJ104_00190 [Deltaproteobacteria bacterium]|nr:hypothetical protein [Deltaproteobacteria bacterium]